MNYLNTSKGFGNNRKVEEVTLKSATPITINNLLPEITFRGLQQRLSSRTSAY